MSYPPSYRACEQLQTPPPKKHPFLGPRSGRRASSRSNHEAPRVIEYEETASTKVIKYDVDALKEARDVALARSTTYQQNLCNYHNRRLHPRSFNVEDLALRLKQDGHRNLESSWDGPYIVTEMIPGGAFRFQDIKKDWSCPSQPVERCTNALSLRLIFSIHHLL
jgi:hypothetical protein